MLIPLSLIGLFPDAQAQTVTPTITGDPFTIGEGNEEELAIASFTSSIVNGSNVIPLLTDGGFSAMVNNVDESMSFQNELPVSARSIIIDLNTTLSELQQTISVDRINFFVHDIRELTTQNDTTDIYLAIFDDNIINLDGSRFRAGTGTVLPLVLNGDPQGYTLVGNYAFGPLFDITPADKKITYIIEFNDSVTIQPGSSITAEFNSFNLDNTPINHITRTHTIERPALQQGQETTYQNLFNVIAARNLAIAQQNIIINYWNNPNNPFADDRTLAQARIDYANSHITQSTIQRDSYQAQLDQILN